MRPLSLPTLWFWPVKTHTTRDRIPHFQCYFINPCACREHRARWSLLQIWRVRLQSVTFVTYVAQYIYTLWTDPSHVTMIIESIYSIPCVTVLSLTLTCPSSILLLFLEIKMSLVTAFGLAIFSVNVNGCFWFAPQIYCYALEERAEIIFSIAKWCLLTENFYSKDIIQKYTEYSNDPIKCKYVYISELYCCYLSLIMNEVLSLFKKKKPNQINQLHFNRLKCRIR